MSLKQIENLYGEDWDRHDIWWQAFQETKLEGSVNVVNRSRRFDASHWVKKWHSLLLALILALALD
jgi:hypothetical protein